MQNDTFPIPKWSSKTASYQQMFKAGDRPNGIFTWTDPVWGMGSIFDEIPRKKALIKFRIQEKNVKVLRVRSNSDQGTIQVSDLDNYKDYDLVEFIEESYSKGSWHEWIILSPNIIKEVETNPEILKNDIELSLKETIGDRKLHYFYSSDKTNREKESRVKIKEIARDYILNSNDHILYSPFSLTHNKELLKFRVLQHFSNIENISVELINPLLERIKTLITQEDFELSLVREVLLSKTLLPFQQYALSELLLEYDKKDPVAIKNLTEVLVKGLTGNIEYLPSYRESLDGPYGRYIKNNDYGDLKSFWRRVYSWRLLNVKNQFVNTERFKLFLQTLNSSQLDYLASLILNHPIEIQKEIALNLAVAAHSSSIFSKRMNAFIKKILKNKEIKHHVFSDRYFLSSWGYGGRQDLSYGKEHSYFCDQIFVKK